jgi:hypothetical protein
MFTGALAASYYGTPCTTIDVEFVVKVSRDASQIKLVPALKKAGLQVDEKSLDAAFDSGCRMVTFEDGKSPFTVDNILSSKNLEKREGTIQPFIRNLKNRA